MTGLVDGKETGHIPKGHIVLRPLSNCAIVLMIRTHCLNRLRFLPAVFRPGCGKGQRKNCLSL